ncbi:MAG: hypothetical protein M1586_01340 [Patescibacteria group bacterium]|nr:hypothetical protein [Patescibacteria group bacterium]MCL5261931.1 hypothetical protein [Patescibacteria group bacterium]
MSKKQIWPIVMILVVIVGAVMLIESFFPENPDLKYSDFAKCLAVKGWTMYGTSTCPHCAEQKAMFKDAFRYINYVGCDVHPEKCVEENISAVPTWTGLGGERITGTVPLEELSRLSGCELPK